MEMKTLKFMRLLIPGLILLFEFLPMLNFLKVSYKIGEGLLSYSFLTILALVIGAIYHMNDIRFTVTTVSHRKIDLNIVTSLLKIYNKQLDQNEYNYLKKGKLKQIFYHFIDNDPSLSAKSKLVYFNGLLWTSTADCFILSVFSSVTFLITGLWIFNNDSIWLIGVLYSGIALLAVCFHFLTIIKHYKLSNDQIEFIEIHYQTELRAKIDAVLELMPKTI
ncbi:MAG: hypothetical protein KF816_17150 [Melioribacteraceae bacterium]|nr:hypothetical protein [Melioribacteraceae bacterium]